MLSRYRLAAAVAGVLALSAAPASTQSTATSTVAPGALRVRMVTDEADAVLAIVAKRRAGAAISDDDWRRLFGSQGYRRLKEREEGMHRPFPDSAFRAFVLSDSVAHRAAALAETVERWKRAT